MSPRWEAELNSARATGVLDIRDEEFTVVPDSVRRLKHLRSLIFRNCRLRTLPEWLPELKNLQVLDLEGSPLRGFPPVICKIEGLRQLGLSNTGIIEIPVSFGQLENLEMLVLSGNSLQEVPRSIRKLRALRMLDLSANRLAALPDELAELGKLERLFLSANAFRDVPLVLRHLTNLKLLDISRFYEAPAVANDPYLTPDCQVGRSVIVRKSENIIGPRIVNVPTWIFEDLQDLRWLYLTGNKIEQLPKAIGSVSQLTGLFMAHNRMGTLPDARLPSSLQYLDLSANLISTLPRGLESLRQLRYLDLNHNPIGLPPEILSKRDEPLAISTFIMHATYNTRRLDEAKVIVVGEGAVGKSSLVKRLVHDQFNKHERRTEGIEITPWAITTHDGAGVTLNTWDFGGQEIMHATHQFFLTKRSVYVLVIDTRQDEDQNRLEHWLKTVQGYSGGSPIIIVGNKIDESPLDLDVRGLRAKYPDIMAVVGTSCENSDGIDSFRDALTKAVTNLDHVNDLLPESFFAVKARLEGMSADYISFSEFEELCAEHGIYEKATQEYLIDFLHDLGTVLCFRDDPRLANTNILNPTWVTNGVYRILNSHLASQKKGLLSASDIQQILDSPDYPEDRKFFIVDMMKKFELCYEDDSTFLVPELLTKSEPDSGAWGDALTVVFKYPVLPQGLMSRFIVRMKDMISQETVWRTGVVLKSDANRALVKVDREDAMLTVRVLGPTKRGRLALMAAIRMQAHLIAKTNPYLEYDERIPVPGLEDCTVSYSHLVKLEEAGHQFVIPEGQTATFSVRDLLDGIEQPEDRAGAISDRGIVPLANGTNAVGYAYPLRWSPRQATALILVVGILLIGANFVILGALHPDDMVAAISLAVSAIFFLAMALVALRATDLISEKVFGHLFAKSVRAIEGSGDKAKRRDQAA